MNVRLYELMNGLGCRPDDIFLMSSTTSCGALSVVVGARRWSNGSAAGRCRFVLHRGQTAANSRDASPRSVCRCSASVCRLMDYTVSLQVQHQLAVFPTHFYQGYSVELQVLHLFFIPLSVPSSSLLSSSAARYTVV